MALSEPILTKITDTGGQCLFTNQKKGFSNKAPVRNILVATGVDDVVRLFFRYGFVVLECFDNLLNSFSFHAKAPD